MYTVGGVKAIRKIEIGRLLSLLLILVKRDDLIFNYTVDENGEEKLYSISWLNAP